MASHVVPELKKYGSANPEAELDAPPTPHGLTHPPRSHRPRDLEREGELSGYTLDIKATPSPNDEKATGDDKDSSSTNSRDALRLAKDGHTILIPQPSDDPDDPLNWSTRKKYVILCVITAMSFIPGM